MPPNYQALRASNFIKKGAGKVYRYSNIGASLAAYLVEVTTRISYAEYVKQHIFQPLGMHQSACHREELPAKNLATLYTAKNLPLPQPFLKKTSLSI